MVNTTNYELEKYEAGTPQIYLTSTMRQWIKSMQP